jgi:hypothetical protein
MLHPFSSVQDLGHFLSATRTAARCGFLGAEGPIGSYVVHQWPASGREGFSAAVDRVDRASGHRGWRCLAIRARKLSLVHARCCRGASEAAQVGGGARQLEWVRNDDTGRPDLRPTPLATYRRCLGPVASHRDLPRRSACETARTLLEPMHGGAPTLGPPVILGRPRFDPAQTSMSPWHPKGIMRPLTPRGGPPAQPWTGKWPKYGHLVLYRRITLPSRRPAKMFV